MSTNTTRSSDSFSSVRPIVNGDDWGCIVSHLETIIVLFLLAFNFIRNRSHHSLTLPRSGIRASACYCISNAWGWHNSHQGSVISMTDHAAYFQEWKKAPKCTGGTITGPKHCSAVLLKHQPAYSDNHPP